jgi:hypothetical protein
MVLKSLTPEGGKVLKKSSGKGPYVLRTDRIVSRSRERDKFTTLTCASAKIAPTQLASST